VDETNYTAIDTPITYSPIKNDNVPAGSTISGINGQAITVGLPVEIKDPVTGNVIGTVTVNADGTVTVTPAKGFYGNIVFDYTVTTPDGLKVDATDTVIVSGAVDDSKFTAIDTPVSYNPLNNDKVPAGSKISAIDGQPLTIGTPIKVKNGTVVVNADGTVTVTPDKGFTGEIVFEYEVTTPEGVKVTAKDTVAVSAAVNDSKVTGPNTPITYNPLTNDKVPAGSTISSIDGQPVVIGTPIKVKNGTVVVNADGTITTTPDQGFMGEFQFDYEVTTPEGIKVKATDTVAVPGAKDDSKTTKVDTPVTYNPLENDTVPAGSKIKTINGQAVTVGTPIAVTNGIVVVNADGTVTVTPNPGFTGKITFPYEVLTPDGITVSAIDTVTLEAVPTPTPTPTPKPTIPTPTKPAPKPTPRTGGMQNGITIAILLSLLIVAIRLRRKDA
ncbi:MAG: Ig-like domain-containing protein, partial [Patescibacteria group bacterium]